MRIFWERKEIFGFIFIFLCLIFVYRSVFLEDKIIFSSNFLAQFYSPWSTKKFEKWSAGIPHKPIGTDPIRFLYPARLFANESFSKKELPLWNPYIFSGAPFIANFQSAVFYPFNIIYFFFSQITAWSILIFIQSLLATIFTYLYLGLFPIRNLARLLGSFAFGFSGFMIIWSQENPVVSQSALWLPLVLFGFEGYLQKLRIRYFVIAIFALSCSLLAGFFQMAFYIFLFSFIYVFVRLRQVRQESLIQKFLWTIVIFLFAILVSALQLFPSIEAFFESPRPTSQAGYLFDTYLLPVSHIVNTIIPDIFGSPGSYNFFGRGAYHETVLYIGVIPLIFAVFISFSKHRNNIVNFFLLSAAASFALTLNWPISKWFYSLPLPLIPTFLPSRVFILTTFSFAVLSAFGISYWLNTKEEKQEKRLRIIVAIFLTIPAFIVIYSLISLFYTRIESPTWLTEYLLGRSDIHFKGNISSIMLRNSILAIVFLSGVFLLQKIKGKERLFSIFIVFLISIGQFYYLNKHVVLGSREFLYPNHAVLSFLKNHTSPPYRFIVFGRPVLGNISTYEKIFSPEGMDPLLPIRYGQLIFATKNGGRIETANLPRIEATLSELGDEESLKENLLRLRLLSLLGVKYIAYYEDDRVKMTLSEKFPIEYFRPIWNNENWHIFEYKYVLPRTYFVENFHVGKDPQEILDGIFASNIDLMQTTFLEEQPKDKISLTKEGKVSTARAEITYYQPQQVEISAKTDRRRILFLSDTYYPGWQAFIDGNPTKIYRANYAFRAVLVPEGDHRVEFRYRPLSFILGVFTSLTFVLVVSIILIISVHTTRVLGRRLRF